MANTPGSELTLDELKQKRAAERAKAMLEEKPKKRILSIHTFFFSVTKWKLQFKVVN